MVAETYLIKPGYTSRPRPEYYDDSLLHRLGITYQPDVYPFGASLARRLGCSHLVDIGCGTAEKLSGLHPQFNLVGIDFGMNIRHCKEKYRFGRWIEWNLDAPGIIPIEPEVTRNSVIICSDVIEHLADPGPLLRSLRAHMDHAPIAILTTPERDLARGVEDNGPPPNPAHVREWNLRELECLLRSEGFNVLFAGLTMNNNRDLEKKTSMLVLGSNSRPATCAAPAGWRVVAMVSSYNQADSIVPRIEELLDHGLEACLIDHGSTDSTVQLAERFLGRGLIRIERLPRARHRGRLARLPEQASKLSESLQADWFVYLDADESIASPWRNTKLKDAFYYVDQCGFNSIDHTTVALSRSGPTDNSGCDSELFAFESTPAPVTQTRAWKNPDRDGTNCSSPGALVRRCRPYPFKFLLKRDATRAAQVAKFQFRFDGVPLRYPSRKLSGWQCFDQSDFEKRYLVERLSGLGAVRRRRLPGQLLVMRGAELGARLLERLRPAVERERFLSSRRPANAAEKQDR